MLITSDVQCHNTKSMKKDKTLKICFFAIGLMILLTVVALVLTIWLSFSGNCKVIVEVSVDDFRE